MDLQVVLKLFAEFLKAVYKDFDLFEVLPASSVDTKDSLGSGENFINVLEKLIDCLKDVHTKLQNKQESSNINSSETKVESKDITIEMEVAEEDGSKSKIKEQGGGHSAPLPAPSVKDKLLSNNIQIKASSQEIERRISAFIDQKRQEVDELNIREFCSTVTPSSEADSSCARVDSVFDTRIGGKSHIKVTRVVNLQGPQTQVNQSDPVPAIKKEPMEDPGFSGGMEERLQNIETHLKLDKREQRTDLFSRVKKMEERILYLESLSPEYFRGGIPVPHSRKRKRIEDNISVRYQDLQNMDVANIDERIHMLRESLRRKAMNRV
nr:MAP3K12-binding inhibitory protein 1 isoform X2 [Crassostrea gigas]